VIESTIHNREKIQLYHCRLGHPSFHVIKLLFPSLFNNLNLQNLHCEVCELAKHKLVSFSRAYNKISFNPFHLIYTDWRRLSNI